MVGEHDQADEQPSFVRRQQVEKQAAVAA